MTSSQSLSEKCPKCGEINPKTVPVCNLCGSLLPWFEARRTAERNEPLTKQNAQKLRSTQGQAHNRHKPSLQRFLSYQGIESPTVAIGDIELSLSHTAAFLAVICLALAAFAPLVNVLIVSVSLIAAQPWLAWGNPIGAAIAGFAIARDQLRWCYASFLLGAISVGVMATRMSQVPSGLVSPWKLLAWGVVPLILGPLCCLVAAYFVGVPEKNTEASPPDQAILFQSRLYERVKELSKTQVFQQALREDSDGLKRQLQQLRGLSEWAQVPDSTKRLLGRAEAELDDGWSIATLPTVQTSTYQTERAPFWSWGLAASVPVLAALLFFGTRYLLTPAPIEKDLGVITRQEWRAKFAMELGVAMLSSLNMLGSNNPSAPSYTIHAQIQMEQQSSRMAYGKLTYYQETKDILLHMGVVGSSNLPITIQLATDVEPANFHNIAANYLLYMRLDVAKRQAERTLRQSERDLNSAFEKFQRSIP